MNRRLPRISAASRAIVALMVVLLLGCSQEPAHNGSVTYWFSILLGHWLFNRGCSYSTNQSLPSTSRYRHRSSTFCRNCNGILDCHTSSSLTIFRSFGISPIASL